MVLEGVMAENFYRDDIPIQIAEKICAEIREEAHQNWDSPTARWCWSCRQSWEGDPSKVAYRTKKGNRGCHLINVRYITFIQENLKL